VQEVEKMMAA